MKQFKAFFAAIVMLMTSQFMMAQTTVKGVEIVAQKPLITHLTMKAVEDMLPTQLFMRVNRSYIVALDKIRKIDRNDCIYIGEEGTSAEIIRVTEAYRETFLQYLQSKFPGAK